MTAPITRRSLLRAAPALAMPAVLAASVQSTTDTAILSLYRQWKEARALSDAAPRDMPEEEFTALVDVAVDLEHAIADAPVTCLEDLAAKVAVCSGRGEWALPESICLECETLVAGVLQ
ncbi:hypothetical protein [Rubellimicrobium roseum]|uniref:Twin-arginine translocation signal domain-containing protein n=1 Tax=Rubellimicrobium roseum TaxID=687525 RepID=A0A5C4NJL6_9RHOB|nr:hypothetical protein [Rubellimicrobium roseum]TNC74150.1 hypothetical protein FHG71_02860 [Rubellimicrobium roseum]